MRDDRLDTGEIVVGGGLGAGQHGGGVEDVQPLVLHRAHVEIVDRDDVEDVEVVFAPVNLLIPSHRAFQRVHGEGAFALIAAPDPDVERHVAPRAGGKAVRDRHQVARDKREEVGGFRPGIGPDGHAIAALGVVAVGQEHRQVGIDPHLEGGHHIGAVGVIGDLAKALGLALGAEHSIGHVEPLQRGVGLGVDLDLGLPGEGVLRQGVAGDGQACVGFPIFVTGEGFAVHS